MKQQEKILVIGACGQIGVDLTLALRKQYGADNVIASDLRREHPMLKGTGPYSPGNVLDKDLLLGQIKRFGITQIYLMAAILSANGEKDPQSAWNLNTKSLLNVLDIACQEKIGKVFWPSSIAVFGPDAPKWNCPQKTITEPATIYGISKLAGEQLCNWYHTRYGLDVRSLRYPGLISYTAEPGGGTTDYAVDIFHKALEEGEYTCFLKPDTTLPMMYMADAIRATIELMQAPADTIKCRTSYNISGCHFSPEELVFLIQKEIPGFRIRYEADDRQRIADSWPKSIDDSAARADWGWEPEFGTGAIVKEMINRLGCRV